MSPIDAFRDHVRGLLRIRTPRRLPRRGRKPRIGSYIAQGDLRMTVQAGLGDELWTWLLEQGWREVTYRPDRRRYREIPVTWVTRLIDAEPAERTALLAAADQKASTRPVLGRPDALPSYLDID